MNLILFIDILSIDHQIVWSQQNCRGGWTQMSVSAVKEQLLNGFDFVLKTIPNSPLVLFRGYSCYNCLLDPIRSCCVAELVCKQSKPVNSKSNIPATITLPESLPLNSKGVKFCVLLLSTIASSSKGF